jgi:hypothetical protein
MAKAKKRPSSKPSSKPASKRPLIKRPTRGSSPARKSPRKGPPWKIHWPASDDLREWLLCGLEKCEAITDAGEAARQAQLPIGALAKRGHVDEALTFVDRFLKNLPKGEISEAVQMARLGAEISCQAEDSARTEKYLKRIAAVEPLITKKKDKGFALAEVRQFKAWHGLLDPKDAVNDEERMRARFTREQRRYHETRKAGDTRIARQAADEMQKLAAECKDVNRRLYFRQVLESYGLLGDKGAILSVVQTIDKAERQDILDRATLLRLGMRLEALAHAEREIAHERENLLRKKKDPNLHFPVRAICDALIFLLEQQEIDRARVLLESILREAPKWKVEEVGWTTAAVYGMLAEIAARINGPRGAQELIERAEADSRAEKRRGAKRGAVRETRETKAKIGPVEEAIANARKLRSPTGRREELGKLLARAKRWQELAEVVSEVATPEEAAKIAWWIKFELPGGEAR